MAFDSRFFGSAGGDPRDYNQLEYAEWVLSSKSSGYVPEEGNELQVMESSPAAMTVDVDTGQGYVQGYFAVNDVLEEVTIDPSHATLDRIDTVVMNLDILDTRLITPVVLLGTPAATPAPPTLQQDTNVWQVALADVLVAALSVSIVDADITDRREQVEGKHTHTAMEENTTHSTSDGSDHSIVVSNQDKIDNSFNMSPETYIGNVGQQDDPINSEYTTVLGTQTQDTTNVKVGSEALRITENDNIAGYLSSKKTVSYDYSILNNNSNFENTDYFNFIADMSDSAFVQDLVIIFRTDASNYFTITINSGLTTGSEVYSVLKSAAVATLSPDWANITEIEIGWTSLINAINEYVTFNTFLPVKKDQNLAIANPLQQFDINDFNIEIGNWFVGIENNNAIIKALGETTSNFAIKGIKQYDNCIINYVTSTDHNTTHRGVTYFVDNDNYVRLSIETSMFKLTSRVDNVDVVSEIDFPNIENEILIFKLIKKDGKLKASVCRASAPLDKARLVGTSILTDGVLAFGAVSSALSYIHSASITEISFAQNAYKAEVANGLTEQPKARVYNSANQSLAGSTPVNIVFDSVRYDTNNLWNSNAPMRFTIKETGTYIVKSNIGFATNATGFRALRILLNGSTIIGRVTQPAVSGEVTYLFCATDYKFTKDDYIEIIAKQTSGDALDLVNNANNSPEFMIVKIG